MKRDIAVLDMNRRKFIAATSVSVGAAGCLTGEDPEEGDDQNETTLETDGAADGDEGSESADADSSDGDETDGDRSAEDGNGEDAGGENGDGDDDSGGGDGADDDSDGDESDGDDDGDSAPSERTTTFESCTRATVSGTFTDGDVAFASTTFYQDGLVGDTLLEDGIVFGDDVDAPFSGTVVFEIGDGPAISEGDDEIVVTVSDYGNDGTVITGLTTEYSDYQIGSVTTPNPDADACLAEIEPDGDSDSDSDPDGDSDSDSDADDDGEASFDVSITDATTPIDAGERFEMTARIENTGTADGSDDVVLLVGNSRQQVASRTVTLEAGAQTTLSMGYETPPVANDQTFPVRVETSDGGDERSVTVYGTG